MRETTPSEVHWATATGPPHPTNTRKSRVVWRRAALFVLLGAALTSPGFGSGSSYQEPKGANDPTGAQQLNRQLERTALSRPAGQQQRLKQTVEVNGPAVSAGGSPRWSGSRISLSLKNADLQEVLRSFSRLAQVNLVLAPNLEGSVTVELNDVPWDQALWVILKSQGLSAEVSGTVLSVGGGF